MPAKIQHADFAALLCASSDSSDILILRWIQIQWSFLAVGVLKILPGLKDEEIVVEQVVLSAEIPPGCFFHLASYHPYIVWVFYPSCILYTTGPATWAMATSKPDIMIDHPLEQADGRGGHVLQGERRGEQSFLKIATDCFLHVESTKSWRSHPWF